MKIALNPKMAKSSQTMQKVMVLLSTAIQVCVCVCGCVGVCVHTRTACMHTCLSVNQQDNSNNSLSEGKLKLKYHQV